jgi:hypothetical protein
MADSAPLTTTSFLVIAAASASAAMGADPLDLQVKIDTGIVEGAISSDSSLRIFRGIPFAAPPVGDLAGEPVYRYQFDRTVPIPEAM